MKHVALRKHYSYFLTDSNEIENNVFDAKLDQFDEEFRELLKKYDLSWISLKGLFIPMEKMSVFHCGQCKNLMINRDLNPAGFDDNNLFDDLDLVIYDGGTFEGKNLCQECFPTSHRWGYFS